MQTENEKVFKNSDRVAFHFQNPQQLSWNRVLNIPFSFCSRLWIRRRRLIQYRIPVLLKNHNQRCSTHQAKPERVPQAEPEPDSVPVPIPQSAFCILKTRTGKSRRPSCRDFNKSKPQNRKGETESQDTVHSWDSVFCNTAIPDHPFQWKEAGIHLQCLFQPLLFQIQS